MGWRVCRGAGGRERVGGRRAPAGGAASVGIGVDIGVQAESALAFARVASLRVKTGFTTKKSERVSRARIDTMADGSNGPDQESDEPMMRRHEAMLTNIVPATNLPGRNEGVPCAKLSVVCAVLGTVVYSFSHYVLSQAPFAHPVSFVFVIGSGFVSCNKLSHDVRQNIVVTSPGHACF